MIVSLNDTASEKAATKMLECFGRIGDGLVL